MSVLIEYFFASCLKRIICKVYFYMFATVGCVVPHLIFKTTSLLRDFGKLLVLLYSALSLPTATNKFYLVCI